MTIVVTKPGMKARRVAPSAVAIESDLQTYIAANPECLPMDDIDEDVRLFVAMREYPTASGPIDAVALDQNGNVYLIETKLFKNADKRRVIAQVLDYGAALWSDPHGALGLVARLKE